MSNIANISRQIAKLSDQLADARANGDYDLADDLEDQINDLEDQLEEAEDNLNGGPRGWN